LREREREIERERVVELRRAVACMGVG